ncbi:hypothetical protein AAFC00_003430 [Neodothiora populina]|uniref:Zn(2)-C6 fungal-type domain-containing protein n=1 Tax=Neodothiora populina TaxID=2781224 RepID=A0ABR3PEP9_9PEZI
MDHDQSPDVEGHARKRRRKVLSCTDCRRRKVQCDRGLPACNRCVKAGKSAACTYEDDPPPVNHGSISVNGSVAPTSGNVAKPTQPSVTVSREVWDDLLSRLLHQERTIERLRDGRTEYPMSSGLKDFTSNSSPHNLASSYDQGQSQTSQTVHFRGKSFKTQFHGATDPRSAMADVPEAFTFAREVISRSPALVRVRRELGELRQLKKSIEKEKDKRPHPDLLTHLPSRDRADAMISTYFDTIDAVYGLFHTPSFTRDYKSFCESPRAATPAFTVTVLLMIACVECFMEENPRLYVADSPVSRERAVQAIEACEMWLQEQSHKHTTLAYFQIHCLLLIAKEMNSIKAKRRWVDIGTFLRLAVAAGLHRDTTMLQNEASPFDQEMRKRIWYFIVEMDLKASLDRGMPAVALEYASDCGLPSNNHDEDFNVDSRELPDPRPDTEVTKMTYFRLSARSHTLRARLTTILNKFDPGLSYEDIIAYTRAIEQHISELPDWPSHSPVVAANANTSPVSDARPSTADVSSIVAQKFTLLRIQLEQFMLTLHTYAARQATSTMHLVISRTVFLTTSRSALRQLQALPGVCRTFMLLFRHGLVRIFVSVGHLGTLPRGNGSSEETQRNRIGTGSSILTLDDPGTAQALVDVANTALTLFEDRLLRSGNLQWTFTFAVYDLLRSQLPLSEQKKTPSGCDRILELFKYIVENQEPAFAARAASYDGPVEKKKNKEKPSFDLSRPSAQAYSTGSRRDAAPDPPDVSSMQQRQQTSLDSIALSGGDEFQALYNNSAGGGTGIPSTHSTSMTELLDWNFDDWMLYNNDVSFWPQDVAAAASSSAEAIAGVVDPGSDQLSGSRTVL